MTQFMYGVQQSGVTSKKQVRNVSYEEFERVELCSCTIVKVKEFPRARKLAYKVWADFGEEIGELQT